MITREVCDHFRLTTLGDHAITAGDIAVHWGNEEFFRPERCSHPSRHEPEFRADVMTAISEHEIGWRSWEDGQQTESSTGLPADFMSIPQKDALEFWRTGVAHFADSRPYIALLINLHAYWLQAHGCDSSLDPAFRHPLLRPADRSSLQAREAERELACSFLRDREMEQNSLVERLRRDDTRRGWIAPQTLEPTLRLLQIADAISLRLCFGEETPLTLLDVPRRGWLDRVQVQFQPLGNRRISVNPYPFAEDPLLVSLKTRQVRKEDWPPEEPSGSWREISPTEITFEFNSHDGEGTLRSERNEESRHSRVSWLTSHNGS